VLGCPDVVEISATLGSRLSHTQSTRASWSIPLDRVDTTVFCQQRLTTTVLASRHLQCPSATTSSHRVIELTKPSSYLVIIVLLSSQRHHCPRVSSYKPSRTSQSDKRTTTSVHTTCGARQLHRNRQSRRVLTDNTTPCKTALRLAHHTFDLRTFRLALSRHSEKLRRTKPARSDIQSSHKIICPF